MEFVKGIRKWLSSWRRRGKGLDKTPVQRAAAPEVVSSKKPAPSGSRPSVHVAKGKEVSPKGLTPSSEQIRRDPYFVQIGLDFGTMYSKCVCRDIMTNKAWIYLPAHPADREWPFLIPCALQIVDGVLCVGDPATVYHSRGLPHVKMALAKAALKERDDPAILPFREIADALHVTHLNSFIAACAVYLLAGILGDIKKDIRRRFPGFGRLPEDYLAVNLAIPVADAEKNQVNTLFQAVLGRAFLLADDLAGHPPLPLDDVARCVPRSSDLLGKTQTSQSAQCFIYPEVSASVQGFVRSRVSRGGIYLFSDTGAATVDQSIFILRQRRAIEHDPDQLTYLYAHVLPLGSSQIERLAALKAGDVTPQSLETWRKRKEAGETACELRQAIWEIGQPLSVDSATALYRAGMKLNLREQLNDIRVLFGGGGHVKNPYKEAVLRAFKDERVFGMIRVEPPVIGMPLPKDLEPKDSLDRWMRRLWVAYGLSFLCDELVKHKYPHEVARPLTRSTLPTRRRVIHPPSKDEV